MMNYCIYWNCCFLSYRRGSNYIIITCYNWNPVIKRIRSIMSWIQIFKWPYFEITSKSLSINETIFEFIRKGFCSTFRLLIFLLRLVPESFAWLHAETKDEKLIKSVKTIARINNKEIPTSVILIHEKKAVETKKTRFFLLFCPLNILIRTLPLAVGW